MKIKYLKNGFDIEKDKFIAFQSIVSIDEVRIFTNYVNYDILGEGWTGENVSKYCSFNINLSNGKYIEFMIDDNIKYFPRVSDEYKKMNFFKRLFKYQLERGCSKEAKEWLNTPFHDMKEIFDETVKVRKQLIKKFNEWKNK